MALHEDFPGLGILAGSARGHCLWMPARSGLTIALSYEACQPTATRLALLGHRFFIFVPEPPEIRLRRTCPSLGRWRPGVCNLSLNLLLVACCVLLVARCSLLVVRRLYPALCYRWALAPPNLNPGPVRTCYALQRDTGRPEAMRLRLVLAAVARAAAAVAVVLAHPRTLTRLCKPTY